MDLPSLYSAAQGRVFALIRSLPDDASTRIVPGTPAWTVPELVAHMCGVACDLAAGNLDGAATESWSARQIAERRGRTLASVVEEWNGVTPALLDLLATPGQVDPAAFDVLTHEHDLRGTLGFAGPSDEEAVALVTARVTGSVAGRIGRAGLPALRIVGDRADWVCGTGEVAVTARASTMEWFRALMGRRSAGQIATYAWDGDPEPYYGVLNLFGPLPDAPVAEAGAPEG